MELEDNVDESDWSWRDSVLGLGVIVVSGAVLISGLVGLNYLTERYQPFNCAIAGLSGTTVEEMKKESEEYQVKRFFEEYDVNKDGSVSREEYLSVVKKNHLRM
ncbi:hypothetical protein COU57_01645 [Candidatus Pacearchaeota archaeon CG10_big_fil_rev_8_21_14_0_10_32_14]|nr:MAG: hypothetical protein COU57_01645 [Candidatus Pacearchaeota archaeon CG10_big_fil_rev_8_21_14_0_10_32_14]